LELAVARPPGRIELARLESLTHRAVRLGHVGTIVEPTLRSELGDIGEGAVEVSFPDLELS
jgi:hypothetical protein